MTRFIPWLLALMASFQLIEDGLLVRRGLERFVQLRRALLVNTLDARAHFCEQPDSYLKLSWRQNTVWSNACSEATELSRLPRYWKIEVNLEYRVLFLGELPITFSIVILA